MPMAMPDARWTPMPIPIRFVPGHAGCRIGDVVRGGFVGRESRARRGAGGGGGTRSARDE